MNVGTSYAEPGMGELYYNWEMYGPNITRATIGGGSARLGWYWVGNPNLKPEKAVNFDISVEGESKKTYGKLTLFHKQIKNYMSIYNTGYLMDFYPQYNENSTLGAAKFTVAPDMIYSFKNIGKAQITGVSLDIKETINDHWKLRDGYTYLRALNMNDPTMPRHLLDKPRHKIDIGVDFKDDTSGWSASVWGDYYIEMLDSNSFSGNGNRMVSYIDPSNPNKSVINYGMADRKMSDLYEEKNFDIWNVMVQKKINKDSLVYFGINNLFDHRDDDRALSVRVYRFGVNLKLGRDKDSIDRKGNHNSSSTVIHKNDSSSSIMTFEPVVLSNFINSPFDTTNTKNFEIIGIIEFVQNHI